MIPFLYCISEFLFQNIHHFHYICCIYFIIIVQVSNIFIKVWRNNTHDVTD